MEGNVFTIGNVSPEFAMMKLEFAKEGIWASHAQIMLNVIKLSLVDQVLYGHMRLSASQWRMLDLCVKLIMIANLEISAGP
jgi:hypothetical protein